MWRQETTCERAVPTSATKPTRVCYKCSMLKTTPVRNRLQQTQRVTGFMTPSTLIGLGSKQTHLSNRNTTCSITPKHPCWTNSEVRDAHLRFDDGPSSAQATLSWQRVEADIDHVKDVEERVLLQSSSVTTAAGQRKDNEARSSRPWNNRSV